mmetsp:Transcript_14950/g.35275  ORF Transcript_14950/g.35275 Transcript_14950/m.35275 type:complete len:327 (-) Transcript_14950:85-1065(-)
MMARKLATVRDPKQRSQERSALLAVVDGFSRAAAARDRGSTQRSQYPQANFAQPATLSLRGWGDALAWLGRTEEAHKVFNRGVAGGLWRSAWCRPEREYRTSLPPASFFFDSKLFPHVTQPLLAALGPLHEELLAGLQDKKISETSWRPESAGLHVGNTWQQLALMVDGRLTSNCKHWPKSCSALAHVPATRLRMGQVKLSVMKPGTVVRPHAGPTNARLRMHCTLLLPSPSDNRTYLRVGTETRSWLPDSCLVFDESCEHSVSVDAEAQGPRVVLIADFANPFLEAKQEYIEAHVLGGEGALTAEGVGREWETLRALRGHNKEEL